MTTCLKRRRYISEEATSSIPKPFGLRGFLESKCLALDGGWNPVRSAVCAVGGNWNPHSHRLTALIDRIFQMLTTLEPHQGWMACDFCYFLRHEFTPHMEGWPDGDFLATFFAPSTAFNHSSLAYICGPTVCKMLPQAPGMLCGHLGLQDARSHLLYYLP